MRHTRVLVCIFIGSWIAAALITPADPISVMIAQAAILGVAVPAYFYGVRRGIQHITTSARE